MKRLFEALFEKFETADVKKEEFLRQKFSALSALELTLGELFENSEQGGWDRWLSNLSLTEFVNLVTGPELVIEEFEAREAREAGRPIKVVRRPEDVNECIIDYIRIHPWSDEQTVAEDIDLAVEVINRKLGELLAEDSVKSIEDGDSMRFALN